MTAGGSMGRDRGKYKRAWGVVECTNRVRVQYVTVWLIAESEDRPVSRPTYAAPSLA